MNIDANMQGIMEKSIDTYVRVGAGRSIYGTERFFPLQLLTSQRNDEEKTVSFG